MDPNNFGWLLIALAATAVAVATILRREGRARGARILTIAIIVLLIALLVVLIGSFVGSSRD